MKARQRTLVKSVVLSKFLARLGERDFALKKGGDNYEDMEKGQDL
jgi:hypothetical protein